MMVIGIVGGIASGKSLVAKCFQQLGGQLIDADRIGHDVLRLEPVKRAIREYWGVGVFDVVGEVDRGRMARTVFGLDQASRERLAKLEQITHPRIAEKMSAEIERLRQRPDVAAAILDAPVLVKAGWNRFCDKIVFVEVDSETRRHRAIARGWTAGDWSRREARQTPLDQAKGLADVVIDNSDSPAETMLRVREIWRQWGLPATATEKS